MIVTKPLAAAEGIAGGRSISPPVLEAGFFFRRCRLSQQHAGCAVTLGIAGLAEFARPAIELVGIEPAVSAIGQRSKSTAVEQDLRVVGALGRPRGVPLAGEGAHRQRAAAG